MKQIIIAIDGPSGVGKSTTAKLVAKKLNYQYLDTGAMYRAVTLYLITEKTENDLNKIENLLNKIKIEFQQEIVLLNGKNVSDEIRSRFVTENVSKISAIEIVREKMVELQRQIAKNGEYVVEGRDIGSVVFPDAQLKIFLTANLEERMKRRENEFLGKGISISNEELVYQIQTRDKLDSTRKISPLKKPIDAIEIDTTHLTIDTQVEKIVELAKQII